MSSHIRESMGSRRLGDMLRRARPLFGGAACADSGGPTMAGRKRPRLAALRGRPEWRRFADRRVVPCQPFAAERRTRRLPLLDTESLARAIGTTLAAGAGASNDGMAERIMSCAVAVWAM